MKSSKQLTFTAMMIAVAIVLNYVSGVIPFFKMPQGGSVVILSSFIIFLIGIRYGVLQGLLAGTVYGLFNFMLSPYIYHPIQFFLDYIAAFAAYGLGVLFVFGEKKWWKLFVAYGICCIIRFAAATTSGVVFFGEFTPEGQTPFMYSAIYNITYIIPEYIVNVALVLVPPLKNVLEENFFGEKIEII